MNACESRLSTIHPNNVENGFKLCGPEALPVLLRQHDKKLSVPNGLVVSGDDSIRGTLGEVLLLCGVRPVLMRTIEQAARHVATSDVRFSICQDRLPDGTYDDLLFLRRGHQKASPLIVVSQTGEWPEYLAAVERGAYDFLAYPLIPGELQRIIRNLVEEQPLGESAPLSLR